MVQTFANLPEYKSSNVVYVALTGLILSGKYGW